MMFGHVETLEDRVTHLGRIRELQDRTGGFTAFICWTFQPENTELAHISPAGAFEYLRTQAIARLYLDNVKNIQSSWVTQGAKVGQTALFFGANDMGSLMIEENVVSSAGAVYHLSLERIKRCIREAGWMPRQQNVFYEYIDREPIRAEDTRNVSAGDLLPHRCRRAVVVAANREEFYDRPGTPPQLLLDRCVVAGLDRWRAGRLGVSERGLLVAVTNRRKSNLPRNPQPRPAGA
jgi:hypothetical protein